MTKVYFIKPVGFKGPIKVGCSCSPTARRDALETWSPFPLEIIAEVEGDFRLEGQFHALFRKDHIRREWFEATDDVMEVIWLVQAGQFDLSTLPEPVGVASFIKGQKRPRSKSQRERLSYSLRMTHMWKRSGFAFAGDHHAYDEEARRGDFSKAEAYLAAPHIHGRPIDAKWAREKQRAWLERAAA